MLPFELIKGITEGPSTWVGALACLGVFVVMLLLAYFKIL